MIGTTISHYKILEKIGQGGMGEVFKAEDIKLHRPVALKFISPHLTQDKTANEQFIYEAQTASSLDHQNISTIYEINENKRRMYISMAYYSGETLKQKILKERIQINEAIDIALQLSEGLSKAHQRGIIHKDIKPANIIINEDGVAKIIDFGLSQLSKTIPHLPSKGIMGTVPYMSPEEIKGKEVDFQTDIWSLGVILYEMLTGRLPFDGEHDQEIIYSILAEDPPPIADSVPNELKRIVFKSLQKNQEKRYKNIGTLQKALRIVNNYISRTIDSQYSGTQKENSIDAIAVLPLENLSGDPAQEYFTEGMTDVLITTLAKLLSIKVISRTSIINYKNTNKSILEIAEELKVDAIVKGTILRVGEKVQLNVQLIDANTDTHIWAESYNRKLYDILFLQSELVQTISNEINSTLNKQKSKRSALILHVNPEPYDNYLKGCFHLNKVLPDHFDKAIEYFYKALEQDPSFALAYTGIAKVWMFKNYWSLSSAKISVGKAKKSLIKALELDNTLEEAHDVMARIKFFYDWDWKGAEKEYKQVIKLNPNFVDSRLFYSALLRAVKRDEEALVQVNKALELDPISSFSQGFWVTHQLHIGQYGVAIRKLREISKTEPTAPFVHRYLWIAYHQKQDYDKALEEAKQYFYGIGKYELSDLFALRYSEIGYEGIMEFAAEKIIELSNQTYVQPIWIARLYAYAENKEKAIQWLKISFKKRDPLMVNLAVSKDWDILRKEPDFIKLLENMNLKFKY